MDNLNITTIQQALQAAERHIQAVLTDQASIPSLLTLLHQKEKGLSVDIVVQNELQEVVADVVPTGQNTLIWTDAKSIKNSFWIIDQKNILVYPGLTSKDEYHTYFRDKAALIYQYQQQFQLLFEKGKANSIAAPTAPLALPSAPSGSKKQASEIRTPQLQFSISQQHILKGEAVTLQWDASQYDRIEWQPTLEQTSLKGSCILYPEQSTNYRLIAYHANRSESKEVCLSVAQDPILQLELFLVDEKGMMKSALVEQYTDTAHYWVKEGDQVLVQWQSYGIDELYLNQERIGQKGSKMWMAEKIVALKFSGIGLGKTLTQILTVNALSPHPIPVVDEQDASPISDEQFVPEQATR